MTVSEPALTSSRKRRVRRVLGGSVGIALCLVLAAVTVRTVLVRQMRLPRLTIAQEGCVTSVSITPDGQTIFSGEGPAYDLPHFVQDRPRDVFVWSAADGRLLRRLPAFYWRSSSVTASPDGKQVIASGMTSPRAVSGTSEGVVAWNWQTGQKQWGIQASRIDDFMPLSYSPDGTLLGCFSNVRAAATGELVCRTSAHGAVDGQSEFTPDGKLFGIINGGSLDPETGRMRGDDNGKSYYATTRLHFWHTETGKEAKDFPFIRVRAFDIARDGQWLVMTSDADGMTGGTDGSIVRRVDFNTGKAVWTREKRMNGPDADPEAVLNSVIISPNGKYVILASIGSRLVVLDAQTGRELFRPFIPPGTNIPTWVVPGGLAFSADGKTLVSRCGRRVLVWDASCLQ